MVYPRYGGIMSGILRRKPVKVSYIVPYPRFGGIKHSKMSLNLDVAQCLILSPVI